MNFCKYSVGMEGIKENDIEILTNNQFYTFIFQSQQ